MWSERRRVTCAQLGPRPRHLPLSQMHCASTLGAWLCLLSGWEVQLETGESQMRLTCSGRLAGHREYGAAPRLLWPWEVKKGPSSFRQPAHSEFKALPWDPLWSWGARCCVLPPWAPEAPAALALSWRAVPLGGQRDVLHSCWGHRTGQLEAWLEGVTQTRPAAKGPIRTPDAESWTCRRAC